MPKWIETLTGSLEQKKQWRQLKARLDALPEPYGSAQKAVFRYLMVAGGATDGKTAIAMMTDFTEMWERAAVDATPLRVVLGEDPAEFAEEFARAYTGKQWIDKERARLNQAIEDAERGDSA